MQETDKHDCNLREVSASEATIACSSRSMLGEIESGNRVEETDDLRLLLSTLERFIPEVLQEIHLEWQEECLDGIYPCFVRKTGAREIEFLGQCIFLSDQTYVPIHLKLQVHATDNKLNWLECRLGENGPQGMLRTQYRSQSTRFKQLYFMEEQADTIRWAYMVTFGEPDH